MKTYRGIIGMLDASCAKLPRIMILNYYFFYFSLCFFVFTKQVLSVFRDYCLSTRVSSSRKWHEFYCFCCRGRLCIDDDGNVVIVVVVVVVVVGGGGSSEGGNDGGDGDKGRVVCQGCCAVFCVFVSG